MARLKPLVLQSLWFGLCFLLFFSWTFPSGSAAERASREWDQRLGESWGLQLEGLSPWRLLGLQADQLRLLKRERSEESLFLQSPWLGVRLHPLEALMGQRSATLQGELYKGGLEAYVAQSEEELAIQALLSEVDLSLIPLGNKSVTLDAEGLLSLDLDLALDWEDEGESAGNVELKIEDLSFSNIQPFLPEKVLEFKSAVLKGKMSNGKLKISRGSFSGPQIKLGIEGEITPKAKFSASALDLKLKIELLDEELAEDLGVFMASARDEAGVYHYKVTGSFAKRRFAPDRSARKSKRSSSTKTPRARPTRRSGREPVRSSSRAKPPPGEEGEGPKRRSRRPPPDQEPGPDEDFEEEEFEEEEFEEEEFEEEFEEERRPMDDEAPPEEIDDYRPPPEEDGNFDEEY